MVPAYRRGQKAKPHEGEEVQRGSSRKSLLVALRPALIVLNSLVVQRRDLLGEDADEEDEQGREEEDGAHVCEAPRTSECVRVIKEAPQERQGTQGKEKPHRGEQCPNLENDQKESGAIMNLANMALATTLGRTIGTYPTGSPERKKAIVLVVG